MKLAGAILLVGISSFAWADTAAGIKALDSRDYATAVREFQTGVDRGDADAEFSLGLMYARGLGVEKDIAEAWRLFQLAAAQGNAQAQFRLGVRSAEGWEYSRISSRPRTGISSPPIRAT